MPAPVVISFDFVPDFEAPGPTLPSLDAPGAGCVWAEAVSDAPNNDATTKAEIASLDRMSILHG
jgi:hypothetical protein